MYCKQKQISRATFWYGALVAVTVSALRVELKADEVQSVSGADGVAVVGSDSRALSQSNSGTQQVSSENIFASVGNGVAATSATLCWGEYLARGPHRVQGLQTEGHGKIYISEFDVVEKDDGIESVHHHVVRHHDWVSFDADDSNINVGGEGRGGADRLQLGAQEGKLPFVVDVGELYGSTRPDACCSPHGEARSMFPGNGGNGDVGLHQDRRRS